MLLLVRTSKEEEDQDPTKQRYRSPYENPLLPVLCTPALYLMTMLLFKAV